MQNTPKIEIKMEKQQFDAHTHTYAFSRHSLYLILEIIISMLMLSVIKYAFEVELQLRFGFGFFCCYVSPVVVSSLFEFFDPSSLSISREIEPGEREGERVEAIINAFVVPLF